MTWFKVVEKYRDNPQAIKKLSAKIRTHEAASRRQDRTLDKCIASAKSASEFHLELHGMPLIVTREAVKNGDIYEADLGYRLRNQEREPASQIGQHPFYIVADSAPAPAQPENQGGFQPPGNGYHHAPIDQAFPDPGLWVPEAHDPAPASTPAPVPAQQENLGEFPQSHANGYHGAPMDQAFPDLGLWGPETPNPAPALGLDDAPGFEDLWDVGAMNPGTVLMPVTPADDFELSLFPPQLDMPIFNASVDTGSAIPEMAGMSDPGEVEMDPLPSTVDTDVFPNEFDDVFNDADSSYQSPSNPPISEKAGVEHGADAEMDGLFTEFTTGGDYNALGDSGINIEDRFKAMIGDSDVGTAPPHVPDTANVHGVVDGSNPMYNQTGLPAEDWNLALAMAKDICGHPDFDAESYASMGIYPWMYQ